MHVPMLACAFVAVASFVVACKRDVPDGAARSEPMTSSAAPSPSSPSTSASSKPPAVAASSLPVCTTPDDPLAAFCTLGADSAKARFECNDPSPLMFCGALDEWSCKYMAIAGEVPPRVTYEAYFDHVGPPVKTGVVLDMTKFVRKGPVRRVSVNLAVKDDAEGKALVTSTSETFAKWGCVARGGDYKTRWDCGTWSATVDYNDIIEHVIVEAAQNGFTECGGS